MPRQHELFDAETGQKFSSLDLLVGESISGGGGGGGGGVNSVTAGPGAVVTGTAANPIVGVLASVIAGATAGATALQPSGNLTGSVGGVPVATVTAGAAAGATALQPSGNLTGSVGGVPVATVTAGAAAGATALQSVAAADGTIAVTGGGTIEATGDFGAKNVVTTGYVVAGTGPSLPTVGEIRLYNNAAIYSRNVAGTQDYRLITATAGNTVTVGSTQAGTSLDSSTAGGITLAVNSSARVSITTGTMSVVCPAISWASSVVAPSLTQLADATATVVGDALLIAAQDCSGTTSVTAGKLVLRAGNATGASGTRNGGSVDVLVGTGATSAGNVSLGAAAPGVQGMQRGVFLADALTVPNGASVGGGFLFSEVGVLKWRGSGNTVTTIAPA